MIQVTLVAGTYQPMRCGVAHYTECLRTALDKQGVPSVILTTHDAAQTACDSRVVGVVRSWGFSELMPLVQAIQATPTDILHIQHAAGTYGFERAIFLLPLLLKLMGWRKPIVTTVHEYGWWEWQPNFIPPQFLEWLKMWGQRRGWWDREDGFLLTHSDAIITTNSDAEKVIHTRLPRLDDRVYRIPIAANVEVASIDKSVARQVLRQTCNWPVDAQIVSFFGFLHPVKGLETLLSAFKQVLSAQPQARLLLVGGVESLALRGEHATNYWNKLYALVSELGLETMVHLTGYLPADVASRYLAGADVGVLPFNHGITLKSGSLLTLMAHGLPVITTRRNPPDCDLADENLVRLVNPRDVEDLATALRKLLADSAARSCLVDAGRAFVGRFAWDAIAKSHLEVYQTVFEQLKIRLRA
ncbi:MAG TPA: glycosyltransferase [Coleofasciculaceae cyanobacterium]